MAVAVLATVRRSADALANPLRTEQLGLWRWQLLYRAEQLRAKGYYPLFAEVASAAHVLTSLADWVATLESAVHAAAADQTRGVDPASALRAIGQIRQAVLLRCARAEELLARWFAALREPTPETEVTP